VGIHLTHLADRIAQLLGILDVMDRCVTVLGAIGVLTRDHEVERADHLIGDPAQVHGVAEHRPHEPDQAAGRTDHLCRITMSHHQLSVGIHRDQVIEKQRVPRVFQGPAPRVLRLQQLQQLLVKSEGRQVARLVHEPMSIARDVDTGIEDLRAERQRHRELALGRLSASS